MEKELFISDGTVLMDSWIERSTQYRESKTVNKSRKEHTCLLGDKVSIGDSYFRVSFINGYGGITDIAICNDHINELEKKIKLNLEEVDPDLLLKGARDQ